MKTYLYIAILVFAPTVYASLNSMFPSTVDELTIHNSHYVDDSLRIIRGQAPLGKMDELESFGVTDILIFKNQTRDEIDRELVELADKMSSSVQYKQIDFLWHDYKSYKSACEKTIDALRYMRKVKRDPRRKLFFHCTVGEDRTGYLAGLWRMLNQGYSRNKAFYEEMCINGYAAGNPIKPDYVVNEIREDLTPLFTYMAYLINKDLLSLRNLTKRYCTDNISLEVRLFCHASERFPYSNSSIKR